VQLRRVLRCRQVKDFARVRPIGLALLIGLTCAGAALLPARAAESGSTPNFAPSSRTGWLAQDDEFIPPPSGPGPVKSDPPRPYISFYKNRNWPGCGG
jgi:hypothetical protein